MAEREDHFGPGRFRAFSPFLAPSERTELHSLLDFGGAPPPSFADALRSLARNYIDDGSSAKLRAVCLLVADLFEQGWRVAVDDGQILFEPPGIARAGGQTVDDVKVRVRAALQNARQRQLREPPVESFLRRMERRAARTPGDTIGVYMTPANPATTAAIPNTTVRRRWMSMQRKPTVWRSSMPARTTIPYVVNCRKAMTKPMITVAKAR